METSKKKNPPVHREEGRALTRKGVWLGFLALVGLGTMTILLSGCGSDSTPVSGKKEKTAKNSMAANPGTITPLLADKGEKVHVAPNPALAGKLPGMLSEEELIARAAKQKAEFLEKHDPATIEVLPGVTLEQLNAKIVASRAKMVEPKLEDVIPGLTKERYEANLAESRRRSSVPHELMPGMTEEQLNANLTQARRQQEAEGLTVKQIFQK